MLDCSDLWMPRKTFEFGAGFLDNVRVKELSAELLRQAADDPKFGTRADLEAFWAREHAAFALSCAGSRTYADYLPGRLFTYLRVVDLVEEYVAPPATIVELGSGSGLGLALLAARGFRSTAFDIAVTAVNFSRVLASHFGARLEAAHVADYYDPPKALRGMFDVVFNVGALEHHDAARQRQLALSMASCSRRWIVVLVPNTDSPIYKTMEAAEFEIMPSDMVYPEEHDTHPVVWDSLFVRSEATLVKAGAIHIAPPQVFPDSVLDRAATVFFERMLNEVRSAPGSLIARWLEAERSISSVSASRWGWFKYAVFRREE